MIKTKHIHRFKEYINGGKEKNLLIVASYEILTSKNLNFKREEIDLFKNYLLGKIGSSHNFRKTQSKQAGLIKPTSYQKYEDYIQNSSEWQIKRQETFKLKGTNCQKCKKNGNHVHHATYERLYKENVETDLYVLCNKCHEDFHKLKLPNAIQNTINFINNVGPAKVKKKKSKKIKEMTPLFERNWAQRNPSYFGKAKIKEKAKVDMEKMKLLYPDMQTS